MPAGPGPLPPPRRPANLGGGVSINGFRSPALAGPSLSPLKVPVLMSRSLDLVTPPVSEQLGLVPAQSDPQAAWVVVEGASQFFSSHPGADRNKPTTPCSASVIAWWVRNPFKGSKELCSA